MGQKQRVIVYIDGFNFYFGLKSNAKWKKYYWLDIVKLFEMFMRPDQELVAVKYSRRNLTILTKPAPERFFSSQQGKSEIQVDIGQVPEKIHYLFQMR